MLNKYVTGAEGRKGEKREGCDYLRLLGVEMTEGSFNIRRESWK